MGLRWWWVVSGSERGRVCVGLWGPGELGVGMRVVVSGGGLSREGWVMGAWGGGVCYQDS